MERLNLGLTNNEGSFLGRVKGDPMFVPAGNGEVAFIKLAVVNLEMGANNQWTEVEQLVPLMITDPNKVDVIKKYVKDGKQLFVKTYYKSWEANGTQNHAHVVTVLKLGSNPYKPQNQQAAPGVPPLPQ